MRDICSATHDECPAQASKFGNELYFLPRLSGKYLAPLHKESSSPACSKENRTNALPLPQSDLHIGHPKSPVCNQDNERAQQGADLRSRRCHRKASCAGASEKKTKLFPTERILSVDNSLTSCNRHSGIQGVQVDRQSETGGSIRGGLLAGKPLKCMEGRQRLTQHTAGIGNPLMSSNSGKRRLHLSLMSSGKGIQRMCGSVRRRFFTMGVSHHVAGARKQSPIHRIRKKMLPQMWQKLEVARSRVKCLLQPPEVSTGEKARALQPRVKAAGKGLERYRALALHTTSCILRGKLTRKFIPSERKDNERRRQLYFTSIERRQRAPEPAQDGIPRIPLTPPAHPQLQHPGRKQPITQESVPSVQLCAFHKAVYRCVGGKASHCCGVSEQSLSASGGHSIEGALQHNLLFQQFSCHAAEKADALPESGYCTQKDASPRVAHQGLSSLPNPRTPEVNVEESSIAGAEMPDPVHISPTNEFKQVLRTWKSKELQAAAYRKKGPMEQIQAVKGTGNSNGHVNKSGQAGNLQRATDEPQAIEVNKTTALADLVAPRATHKLKQPAAAEATIKLTPNMASKYVSQAAFAEPSEATPTDVLAAEPGGQSLQNSRTMDYRETVGLKEAVPRKPESIQSTTVLQKLGTNPFEVTEHSNRQTSEAESATKAEAADNDNRKATEAVGIMLEGKETPTACKKPCEEGRGEGHMRELGREQRTSKVLPTSGIGEEAQHKTSGTDSFVEVLPTKWEIFTLFLGSLFIYVLIFLCTRGVPHAILLLFCCLFGLRIRIGGSGSSSGGSYTALWLLVLQLLVLVAMCIISLVKQTANAEELLKQLENNRLYEADVRITGTLLFVSLLFLGFLVGFLALGYLGFGSFYSFVFQPIEICVFSATNLRNFNVGVQFAVAMCLFCLGGYGKCAGLMIFLALAIACGRLLMNFPFGSCLRLHEARDKKGHSRLFLVSSGIQVVALVGALAVICTVKHPTVKTQQKRPAKVALAMSLVAIFLDFILLCAQIAAYKFSKLAETPGQRAAVVIAGGDFDEPAAQLCIVGRLNVHYDVECATYESTSGLFIACPGKRRAGPQRLSLFGKGFSQFDVYGRPSLFLAIEVYSYYLVVQSYAGKTLWCLLLGTVKTPLPKALREQQRQRRKLQEIYFSPSATAAAPTEPQKLNLETTVLLSLHSKAFAREASRALDVVGVRRLQTLVLAAFGSTDLNGGLSTPVKLHQQQAHKHSAAFSQSGYLDTETSHGLVTASHSPSLHSLSPHKEAAYNAEPSCRKCSDKDANFSLPMDQRRSSGASMRGPSTRDSENCSGRQRRPSESLHLHENRSRKNSSGKLKTARSYHRDRSNKGARAHSKRQSNEAVKEDHERKAVAPVDDHTTRANEPPSKVATISADVDATMPSKSANPFDEEKEEAVALPPLPAVADEEGSRGSMHLDGCDQQSSSPVEAPVASAEKAAAVVTGDCEAALLHNLSEVLKQLQIEHPQLLKSVPYFATKLQEEGAQRALGELLEQMPSNKKALLATCYSCTEARRDFTTDWQLTELMKLLRDAEILQKQRDGQGLQVQDQQLQHEQQQQEQKVLQAEPKLQQVQQEQQQEEVPLQEQQQEEVPLQEQQQQVQQHEERKALQEEPKQRLHEQEQQQEPMQLSEQDQQLQQQDQKVLLEQHQHLQQQEEQKILQEQEQEKHARLAEEQQMQLEEMQQQNERQQQPQQQKLHCMQQGQQLQQAQQLQPVHQQQWQEENQLQQNQLHEEQQKPQHEYRQQQPQEEAQSQVQQEEVEQRLQEIKCAKQQVQLLQQNEQDKFQTLQQQKEQQMQQERQQTLEEKQQQQELQQMQQEDLLRQQETQRPSQEEEQQQRQQKHEECGSINPVQDEGTAASPMPAAKEAEDDEVGPWSPVEAATQGEAVATPTETKLLSEDQTVKTGLTIGAADASDAAGAAAAGVTEVEVAAMAGDAAAFSPGHRRPATGGTGPLAHEVPQGLSYSPDSAAEASTAGCAIPLPPFQDSADLLTPLESRGSIGGPLGCPLIAEDEAEEIQERLLRHVAQQQRSAAGTGSNSSMVFFPHGAFDSFLPEGDPGTKTQCDAASEGEAETVFSVFLTRQRQKQAHEARSASASPTVPLCISDIDMLSYSLPASSSRYNQQLSDQQQQTRVPFEEVCNPSLLPTLEPLDLRYPSVGPISEAPLSSRGVLSSEGPSVQSTRTSAGSSMAGPLTARETPVVRSPTWLISQQAESPQTILLQRRRGGVSESIEERPHAAVAAAAGNARASLRAAEATSYRSSNSQRRFSDTRDGHISPESLGLVSSSVTPKTYSFHSFRTNPDATESISRAAVQTTAGRPEATTAHEELPFLSGTPLSGFKEVTGDFQATRRQPLPQIPEVQSSRTVSSYHETANIENAGRSQYPLTPMDPNSYHPLYQRSQFQESIEGCYTGKHPRRGLMHRGRNSSSSQTIVGRTSIDERLAMGRRIRTSSLQVENNMRGCTPRILPIEPTSVIPEKATVAASAVDMSRKPSPSRQHQRPLRRDQETQALMGGRSSPPSEEEKLKGRELQERFERLTEMEKQQQQQQEMLQKQQDELSPMKGEPPKALNGDRALAGSRNNSPQRCKKQQQPLLQQQSSMRLNTSGQLGRMPSALLGAQYSSISPSQLSAAPLEEPLGSTPSMRSSRSLRSLYQQRQPPSQLHELQHQLDVQQQHNIRERERRAEAELESLMERERQGSRRRQERQQQLAFLQQQQQIFLSQYRRDRQRRRLNCSIDRGLDSSEGVPIQQLLEGATLPENKSTEAAQNEQQGGRAQARMQRPEETSTDSAREGTKNLPKQSTVSSGIFGVRTEDDLRDPGLVEAEARETECAEAAAVVAGTAPASAAQSTATQQEVGADYHRQVFGMPDGIPFGASSGFCGDKARNDVSIRYEATSVQTREDAYTIQKDLAIQQPQLLRMAAASTAATAETLEEAPKEKTADVAVETDFSVETPVSDIFGLERERIDDGENEEAAQHQLQQPQQRSNKKTLPATVERSQEGSEIFALPLEAQRQQQEWDEDTLAAAEGRQQIAAAAAAASAAAAAARAAVATATAAEAQIENTKQGDEVLEIDVLSPEVDEPIELLEPTNEASDAPPYRAGSPSAPQNRSNRAASCSSGRVRAAISEELRETSKTKSNFNHVTGGAEADEEKKHEKAHRRRRRSSGETGCRGPHSAAGVDSTYQHPGQQEAYTDLGEFTQKGLGGLSSHLKRDRHEGRHFSAAAPTLPSAHGLSFPWCAEGSLEGEGHRYAPQFVERYYMKERRGSDAGIDGSSGAAHWSSAGSGTWGHSKGCQTRGSRSLSRRGARLDFSGAPAAAKAFAAKVKDRLKPFLSRQETKGSPGDPVDDLGERPRHLYSGVTHRRSYGATPSEPAASTSAAGVAAASAAMPPTSDFNLSELPMLMRAQQQREANRKRAQQKSAERHRTPDGGISQDRTSSKPSQVAARTPHNLQY